MLRRRWPLLVVPAVVVGAVGLVAGLLQPTSYLASALVEVVAAEDLISPSVTPEEVEDQELATQVQVFQSEPVATVVVERLELDVTPRELLTDVATQRIGNARVLQVTVRSQDRDLARRLSAGFAEVYLERRAADVEARIDVVRSQLERQRAALDAELATLRSGPDGSDAETAAVAERRAEVLAELNELPSEGLDPETVGTLVRTPWVLTEGGRTRALAQGLLGATLGLLVGLAVALVRDRSDARVRDDDELLQVLAVDVLEHVHGLGAGVTELDDLDPRAREDLRRVHAVLSATEGVDRLLVVAPGRDGRVAAVAAGLAQWAWRAGRPVLVVDGDLRDAELSGGAGFADAPGLAELVRGDVDDPATLAVETSFGPPLLPAGTDRPAARDRLATPDLGVLVDGLGEGRQLIVAGPAAAASADVLWLAAHVDAVLLVVALERTRVADLRAAAELLAHAGRPVHALVVRRG